MDSDVSNMATQEVPMFVSSPKHWFEQLSNSEDASTGAKDSR